MTNNSNNSLYNNFTDKVSKELPTFIIGAATLTAGLAWNEAFKSGIDYLPLSQGDNTRAKFIYAIILTIIIILIIVLIEYLKSRIISENYTQKNNKIF